MIVDANKIHVPYVGINCPEAADTMLPEGLNFQTIENIMQKVSRTGFNSVRLTFAIEMVDDILDNRGDVILKDTLTNALGESYKTIVLNNNNPQFTANMTRLQVECTELALVPTQLRLVESDISLLGSRVTFDCDTRRVKF